MKRYIILTIVSLCLWTGVKAQTFFNLTADEVKIDSLLPCFTYQRELGACYADSVYEVSIDYPEFYDMTAADVARYHAISQEELPELPVVNSHVSVSRKQGVLEVSFLPLVKRDGRYQKLVSFMLRIEAREKSGSTQSARLAANSRRTAPADRYASHSVLASGRWVKIAVAETGVYQLTPALIQKAGFSDLNRVKVYGYGGALQPESLTGDYLIATDDLKEVPTFVSGNSKLFHAVGPVNWESATDALRQRNNYSSYGYYFLTEGDNPATVDEQTFRNSFYPHPNDYHVMVEPEEYAWYHGGRNLFAKTPLTLNSPVSYTLENSGTGSGTLSVAITYDGYCNATVALNGNTLGTMEVSETTVKKGVSYFGPKTTYSTVAEYTWDFPVEIANGAQNTVTLTQTSGSDAHIRLDRITLTTTQPRGLDLSATKGEPTIVGQITPQDHHADTAVDMVIIIPASQKWLSQAQRLKTLHEEKDSMTVRIVPADELYNEFSSGTPDANAYRRYLKMFYDRAQSEDEIPRFLLLMGDCAWDNRMLISEFSKASPDDYLLCYESENSFSNVYCYVSDDYFCLLDDEEIIENYMGKPDVAVGRISASSVAEAQTAVDKIIGYRNNEYAGDWQNTMCFLGDDGDSNQHMEAAEAMVKTVTSYTNAYNIKKVYWDAYTRVTSSTGNTYPEVRRILKQQMRDGALLVNYSGHGSATTISHEQVLFHTDFSEAGTNHLPLWITASCDIMPFDTHLDNIGEKALFNASGGAIAFFGTMRTVFMDRNTTINRALMKRILATDAKGKRIAIGEAVRLAKNELVETGADRSVNKMNYGLLGDPALTLAAPTLNVIIDSINGKPVDEGTQQMSAGARVTVSGHVEGRPSFNGVGTFTIRDIEETIVCKKNNSDEAMTYLDRPNTIYSGKDSIRNGRFNLALAIPKDISYSSNSTGQILVYAIDNTKTMVAHGEQNNFTLSGTAEDQNDGKGPSIYCYLNKRSFSNGDVVNATPYFYAELTDKDGINAAGSGIGHDMELIVDGDMSKTYVLNSYYQYNFGDYCSGTVGYSLPTLEAGEHKLLFRAWDVLNNSSVAELSFVVDPTLEPEMLNIVCTRNPANTNTRFLITHDRTGSQMDVTLEIYDPSGRILWSKTESGVPTDQTYAIDWDLTGSSGSRLRTGIYLYRVLISSNGSSSASASQKLIIIGNN